MGTTPSQHLEEERRLEEEQEEVFEEDDDDVMEKPQQQEVAPPQNHHQHNIPFVLQDDMGVVIALPATDPPSSSSSPAAFLHQLQQHHHRAPSSSSLLAVSSTPPDTMWGRRVLDLMDDSPAAKAGGLVPWLDFVIGCNGRLFADYHDQDSILPPPTSTIDDKPSTTTVVIRFHVFNAKTNTVRECVLGEFSSQQSPPPLLGIKLGPWTVPTRLPACCLRVVGVQRNSPAQECGLESNGSDYLLGAGPSSLVATDEEGDQEETSFPLVEFLGFADLEDVLSESLVVDLYVYNSQHDDVRVCALRPHNKWGDEDAVFGADLASGLLHRLPSSCLRSSGRKRWQSTSSNSSIGNMIGQWVRTPEGMGQVLQVCARQQEEDEEEEEASYVVKLDWGFGNDAHVTGKFLGKHLEPVLLF